MGCHHCNTLIICARKYKQINIFSYSIQKSLFLFLFFLLFTLDLERHTNYTFSRLERPRLWVLFFNHFESRLGGGEDSVPFALFKSCLAGSSQKCFLQSSNCLLSHCLHFQPRKPANPLN